MTSVCLSVRNLDLTKMSLRLSVRRKATRGVRGEDERILKCFCMILDMERREGLYVKGRVVFVYLFTVSPISTVVLNT